MPGPRGSLLCFPQPLSILGIFSYLRCCGADARTAALGIKGATAPRLGDL